MENGERARERAEGLLVGGSGAFILGSFSSSEPWPQIFPLRSAVIGECQAFPLSAASVAQCALPLQLSRRKQISNVALNKPGRNVPWYSCAQGCYWGSIDEFEQWGPPIEPPQPMRNRARAS